MDLRQLRYFVAVAEELHFGRAADRLHVAQPPVSQQIRRLEAELGVHLFQRTTRRVELTQAAAVLLPRARQILREVDMAAVDTRRAAAGEIGRLAIGFTGSATYALLPTVAKALRDRLPRVELELHGEMLTPAQVRGLQDGTLDLALLRPPVRQRALEVEVISSEPLIAILPEGHRLAKKDPLPVEELADEPFIAYPSDFRSVLHDAVEAVCEAHGFLPKVVLEVSETSTLVGFVAAGIGISLVPASVMQMTVAGAVYRLLAGPPTEIQLALVWRRDDENPVLERAHEILRQVIATAGRTP